MSYPMMKLFGVALLAGIVFAGAGTANAFEITQSIPNTDENACVDVAGSQDTSGTAVLAWRCNGGFSEQWSNVGGDLQGLGTTANGANCADADSAGQHLILDSCKSPRTWRLWSNGEILNNDDSAACLDSQGQYGNGAQIALKSCTTGDSQKWVVRDIVFTQPNPSGGYACTDVQGDRTAKNTPVIAYPCNFGVNERWTWINGQLQGNGTSISKATCLGAKAKKGVQFAVLQTCDANSEDQYWEMIPVEDNEGHSGVEMFNVGLGGCLDTQGNYGSGQQMVVNGTCTLTTELWAMR